MPTPSSTYRIQLHKDFAFADLQRILKYIHALGVSTVYASPIMTATPGSLHGYDVTDPHSINPEIGNLDELKAIVRELCKVDMSWLQDIVPNHMAFHTRNFRLMDVLERGPASPYYTYFDIDWHHPDEDLNGKVMVPFLGDELKDCINRGEIALAFSPDGFKINYFDTAYPLSLSAYQVLARFFQQNGYDYVIPVVDKMMSAADGANYETWQTTKAEYMHAIAQPASGENNIGAVLSQLNGEPQYLLRILDKQFYRLCFWKETDRRINYRRFFTVNELICLRMEDEKVFDEYHTGLLKLLRDRTFDGFRIDHIDGLYDPAKYTQDLRAKTGDRFYIIAEKILEAKEDMPAQWPLQGTSGYEFLSILNQLLTNRKGARQLLGYYKQLVPEIAPYRDLIFASKKMILENYMSGEWDNLTRLFVTLKLSGTYSRDRLRAALGYFMLSLPVYRIYPDRLPLRDKSLLTVHEAFDRAVKEGIEYTEELNYLRTLFTSEPANEADHEAILTFIKRLMQFTGPLTAKGVEDTTFYIYNPLISHDEVGDSPAPLGMTVRRFHEKMQARQTMTPLSLNATATHDTKRGEDARIRINVLSRIPDLWQEKVKSWFEMNARFRGTVNDRPAPGVNDEYFIYQSMLGGFPADFKVTEEWMSRVQAYLNKALREAKVNTNWSEPDEAYEKSCERFIEDILSDRHEFLSSFIPFVRTVCEHAMVYSLSQTLIKLTAPGIPDVYQGCELWDLSFVDPDNRRAVDYEKRMEFLFQLVVKEEKGKDAVFEYLRENRELGIEKLYIIWKTLNFRKAHADIFEKGDYIPLAATGSEIRAAGYARNYGRSWVMVVFPFGLVTHDTDNSVVTDQYIVLPEAAPKKWLNLFTGAHLEIANQLAVKEVFSEFPVALLVDDEAARTD